MAGQVTNASRATTQISVDAAQRLAFDLARVCELAAISAARTMGQGDRKGSDHAAVQAMRAAFEDVAIDGNIVIGEGERDEAPMLYIGERVGALPKDGVEYPAIDIAVDPLEGTNLCATGAPNSIAVLAASEAGGLLHAPDCYMEKLIAGPGCQGALDIDAPVEDNLKAIANRLERQVKDLVVIVLDRPRHEKLIADIRKAGARIRLIGDGDLSAGITAAVRGAGVHAVMGTGGAPEGVITAAAIRCLHGEMLGRLVVDNKELEQRMERMGITDPHKIYRAEDLAPGKQIIFVACGVTPGSLLQGVRFFGDGYRTHSMVITLNPNNVRFLDTVHVTRKPGPRGVRLY
ncbi:MAG TPA: class II fructose-bisphosphatase [Bryobacteraceae bacterium]|nr:class II fructose-bisphosphatase [Bryobacteraceae bacterium]